MKRLGAHTKQLRERIPYLHEQMVEIKMQVAAVTLSNSLSRVESHENIQPSKGWSCPGEYMENESGSSLKRFWYCDDSTGRIGFRLDPRLFWHFLCHTQLSIKH